MLLWGYESMRMPGGYSGLSDVKTQGTAKKCVIDEVIFTIRCISFG
jgi:hypothetical protein